MESPSSTAFALCGISGYAMPPTAPDSRKLKSIPPVGAGSGPSYDGRATAGTPATVPSAHDAVTGMFRPAVNQ